jgi:ubiquinone/menaquinone biosynthesis C-methylase UbiE
MGSSLPDMGEWDSVFDETYLQTYVPMASEERTRTEALGAASLAEVEPEAKILDCPTGFGRHALVLAEEGFHVTGLDRSETLLAEAERRRGEAEWPRFVRGDYRELPFEDASFDAAINLYSSLGYLGDEGDQHVLAELARVLRPGGRLVIETMHRDLLVREFDEDGWHLVGQGRLLLEQRAFDPAGGVAQTTQTLIETSGERESRTFAVRVYTATELSHMLAVAGFAKTTCYGDLTGAPFTTGSRLVIVARR